MGESTKENCVQNSVNMNLETNLSNVYRGEESLYILAILGTNCSQKGLRSWALSWETHQRPPKKPPIDGFFLCDFEGSFENVQIH